MTCQSLGFTVCSEAIISGKSLSPSLEARFSPEDEGLTECLVVVVTTRESKTNCKGWTQYAAMMRSKDVFMCPVWSRSAHLFAR